ncbi:universal stress protein [Chitinophaga caseinilytica]|uniref:universal stress protein n=1 Tax=Chitinophaga caseinilytica TaxID=2267521 RepID=UPI003C2C672D
MQRILVPVDFSDTAFHAARYAISLARQIQPASITLFHAYGLPPAANSTVMAVLPGDSPEYIHGVETEMAKWKQDLQSELVEYVQLDTHINGLPFMEAVQAATKAAQFAFIVMGITGKSPLGQRFIGSNALDVAHSTHVPLIIVSTAAEPRKVKRILFAYDRKQVLQPEQAEAVRSLLKSLDAHLEVVHVSKDEPDNTPPPALTEALQIEAAQYREIQHTDLVAAIQQYAGETNADLLLAIPGEYGFFAELFHRSATKQLAYNAGIPVLVIR